MAVSLIVAVSSNGVIGRAGGLPWHLPRDLRHFKSTTMGHHLIIGRRTWQELGRPLPGRTMVVVSRDPAFEAPGATVVGSLAQALSVARADDEPFIGGGAHIYDAALEGDLLDRMYMTRVHADVAGDTFFPEVDFDRWQLISEEHHPADEKNEFALSFLMYERDRHAQRHR